MSRRLPADAPWPAWVALATITVVAGALRLVDLASVASDPFYDAAVRSMGLSWHNFFFGAFEPGGSVSIDKPPVDLWLQVASVKLLGFSSTALKLPEALAGTAAVPLLFAAVRRMWDTAAGLAAAGALALLPVDVITSRSDTMDGVMMLLIVLALLAFACAAQRDSLALALAGAVALGLAFDVKLLESLVALPALAVFAYAALAGSRLWRLARLALTGAVYVAVALSWLTATLIFPAHERPWAIGSTNGSAWNAAFVFNGSDRLGGKTHEPQFAVYDPGHRYPTATQSERDHIPIVPPSPTRLLARVGPLSGQRLGLEVLDALLLGLPALLWALLGARTQANASEAGRDRQQPTRARVRRATALGLALWMTTGIALFSAMARLHPRYVESFTPAVAALLGVGAAWATARYDRARATALAITLAVTVYYSERLLYGTPLEWWIALAGALVALGLSAVARARRVRAAGPAGARMRRGPLAGATLAATLVCLLAIPFAADVSAIENHVSDAGYVGAIPPDELRPMSAYLRSHQGPARYEVAAEAATQVGALVVADARPILVLTTYDGRVLTGVARLARLAGEGQVRYAFLSSECSRRSPPTNAACSAPARWIRAHAVDVSRQAGLPRGGVLWRLPAG
jgi:4-amino-4-deoxy-L-arabinose transferase-like glycosyltransferase